MIDPRASVVARRLSGVRRVVAVCSAKGGVGKTSCTALAGLMLAHAGQRTGILDLDLAGASVHLLLGVTPRFPEEDRGILPLPVVERLGLMSAAIFTGERALPLRGASVSDAMLELLAVTRWADLDCLLIDMPPGIGEEILDLARLVPRMTALVVSTPERLSITVVERFLGLLKEMGVATAGIIANMVRRDAEPARELARRAGVPFAGEIPFDETMEACGGDPARLAGIPAAAAVYSALMTAGLAGPA